MKSTLQTRLNKNILEPYEIIPAGDFSESFTTPTQKSHCISIFHICKIPYLFFQYLIYLLFNLMQKVRHMWVIE